ncbi:MAG: hypothetical protein ABI068_07145 [Ktedonobacterales bacterium]
MSDPNAPDAYPSLYPAQPNSGEWSQQGQAPSPQEAAPAQPSPQSQPGMPPQSQPAAPYQTFPGQGYQGPYSQPLPPGSQGPYSQPLPSGAYGQPGTPSQGMYSQPGYAPAPPGYAGPNSQTLYGQPGAPSQGLPPAQPVTPAAPRKRPRLIVPLIVAAVLLIALGGSGVLAYTGYYIPTTTAAQKVALQFCGDLTSQNYDDAYNIASSKVRGQYTQTQLDTDMKTLDQGGGMMSDCKATSASAYHYTFGASVATLSATASRSSLGTTQGVIHLTQEGGQWKVDAVDSGLFGATPASVQVVASYCTALQNQDYTTAYSLLGSTLQSGEQQSAYTATEQLHDTIDGKVTACSISTIFSGADDSHTSVQVSITRANLDAQTSPAVLGFESSAWKIQTLDSTAEGRDVGPYQAGQQFCGDLKAGNYAGAYGLTSSGFQFAVSKSSFISLFTGFTGAVWSCGHADFSTYKVDSGSASYNAPLQISLNGQTVSLNTRFDFVDENGAWKVADFVNA